jgi:hydroxymethylpyrimidine/phosphomethylpyrimidine kinase
MFPESVAEAYRTYLVPRSSLITPNWPEAVQLAQLPNSSPAVQENIDEALNRLHAFGASNVLITGIRKNDEIADIYSNGAEQKTCQFPRLTTENRHGSGDTLSAAICAFLAQGHSIITAIQKAQQFTAEALQKAQHWRMGKGHGPLSHFP